MLSAAIGEGHDLPARILAADLEAHGAAVHVADSLEAAGPLVRRLVLGGSSLESAWGNLVFDVMYRLITDVRPTRRVLSRLGELLSAPGLLRLIAAERPDVIVSTYPGATEVLGRLRRKGRLHVPVASAITDLAALDYWAHAGVDLHLITHPESAEEVRRIAGPSTAVVAVRGLNDPAFLVARERGDARRALGLPAEPPVVVVSGGGWGIGDLGGAVEAALAVPSAHVVVMCGRNDALRERLAARFGADERVALLGFTDQVPDLFASADALVHSTAGLTVLEAHVRGLPVISYGWGRGHIRANNRAFRRFGIAEVATTREELREALARALAAPRTPRPAFADLPSAADVVLERLGGGAARAQLADRA